MRKIMTAVLCGLLVSVLIMGCGKEIKEESSSSLERVSTVNYNAGMKMLEYADEYLSFNISEDEFIKEYYELDEKMINEKPRDALVSSASYLLKTAIESYGKGNKGFEDVIAARDHLAEILEEPAYENGIKTSANSTKSDSSADVPKANSSEESSNTSSKGESTANGDDVYEIIAEETYPIVEETSLKFTLYKQPSTGMTSLGADVEAPDFKTIKQLNDVLYTYVSTDKAFDDFIIQATINGDMVFSYTYHVMEGTIPLVFGKETLTSELTAKAPSWSMEDTEWDDVVTQGNILINTADAYNDFAEKHNNN